VLLGTAVGDSIGLPAEGLSPARAARLFPDRWRQRLILGSGLVSDDTEHTVFVAQSLLAHPESANRFARRLAWCLRLWLMSLPPGIGLATLRSILRLWIGIPPDRSGVFSAGNGAAMRSAPFGVLDRDRGPARPGETAAARDHAHSWSPRTDRLLLARHSSAQHLPAAHRALARPAATCHGVAEGDSPR
jgi:ADP-ribosylglycohydrolase